MNWMSYDILAGATPLPTGDTPPLFTAIIVAAIIVSAVAIAIAIAKGR